MKLYTFHNTQGAVQTHFEGYFFSNPLNRPQSLVPDYVPFCTPSVLAILY